jgi:hypothetical protein
MLVGRFQLDWKKKNSFNLGYEKANCRRSQGSFYTG